MPPHTMILARAAAGPGAAAVHRGWAALARAGRESITARGRRLRPGVAITGSPPPLRPRRPHPPAARPGPGWIRPGAGALSTVLSSSGQTAGDPT